MIPGILNQDIPSSFIYPRNIFTNIRTSLHIGGVALGDLSLGRDYQVWTLEVSSDSGSLLLSSPTYPPTLVVSGTYITECSLAFDQNLNPLYAWVDSGICKYRWFDIRINNYVVTELIGISPNIVLDDVRDVTSGISDVILSYIRDGNLCYRMQRDFYDVQYIVGPCYENGRILRCGMQEDMRFSWELIPFS